MANPEVDVVSALRKSKALTLVSKELESLQRTSIRFQASVVEDELSMARGLSKLGGRPDLPADEPWPTSKLQLPEWLAPGTAAIGSTEDKIDADSVITLPFIGQFNMLDLRPFDKEGLLPRAGLLLFFYNTVSYGRDYDWGTPRNWRVIWVSQERMGELQLATAKRTVVEQARYKPCTLAFSNEPTLPHCETSWIGDAAADGVVSLNEEQWRAYANLLYECRNQRIHQLLGHSDDIQPYALETGYRNVQDEFFPAVQGSLQEEFRKSRLLLQIDEEKNGMRFGRGGRLYFFIREADLAACDFSKVWAIEQ